MASTSRLQFDLQKQGKPTLPASVPLPALPFPAAVLDSAGNIVETNGEWDQVYPGFSAGGKVAAWAEHLHAESPHLLLEFLEGFGNVISGGAPRFAQVSNGTGASRRVVLSGTRGGALLLLDGASEPPAQGVNPEPPHSPRLATIGRTVSGVAHDFANLLTLIAGYGDLLLSRVSAHDPNREEINEIRKAAERGARLTSQLLGFTREASTDPQLVDLNALVNDIQQMLRPILGETVEVAVSLEPQLARVLADPGQLEQVVMNLLLNARDAMPGGGRIQIETAGTVLGEEEACGMGMAAGRCVLLSVTDSGQGIAPGAIDQIFQPFYTTKPKGEGTGLGLSIVLRIVKEYGGAIRVQNSSGAGARFLVYLPASPKPAELGDNAPQLRSVGGGSETLLIVEDDEAVRRLMVRVLQQQGYEILAAADGEEALELLEEYAASIRLVLTDMIMPRMGGRELASRVRASRPGLPVICMSGYTDEVLSRTGDLDPGMSFLRKPLRPEVLASKVREALDSASLPFNPR